VLGATTDGATARRSAPDVTVGDARLPRSESLTSRIAFRAVYDEGRAHHGEWMVMITREDASLRREVGFVASKKVGNAVRRNRARRLLREAWRHLREQALTPTAHVHVVFVARRALPDRSSDDVARDMRAQMVKAGWIRAESDGDE
jgi:ribonuclease P protein component